MQLLIIDQEQVRELLPMGACIEVVSTALGRLSRGEAVNPLRSALRLPSQRGLLGLMPACLGDESPHGVKVISVFPGNHGSLYDAHQGVVLLFEGQRGCPIAVMDASEITAIRTAAASALATRLLAREDASRLTLLGSGIQARTHLEAMLLVRPIKEVRVWSRDPTNAERFAQEEAQRLDVSVLAVDRIEQALEAADIVCTTTSAREPIVRGAWLPVGCHINAVGACQATTRELDSDAMARMSLFTDCLESLINESGDYLIPHAEGRIRSESLKGELGQLLSGQISGRSSDHELTLFKSLGVGVEDLAAAEYIYKRAQELGSGTRVAFGAAPEFHA